MVKLNILNVDLLETSLELNEIKLFGDEDFVSKTSRRLGTPRHFTIPLGENYRVLKTAIRVEMERLRLRQLAELEDVG